MQLSFYLTSMTPIIYLHYFYYVTKLLIYLLHSRPRSTGSAAIIKEGVLGGESKGDITLSTRPKSMGSTGNSIKTAVNGGSSKTNDKTTSNMMNKSENAIGMLQYLKLSDFSARVMVTADYAGYIRIFVRSGGINTENNNPVASI